MPTLTTPAQHNTGRPSQDNWQKGKEKKRRGERRGEEGRGGEKSSKTEWKK